MRWWDVRSTRERFTIPELPEVETVRRELEPWLTGRVILAARRVEAPPGPKYAGLERAEGQSVRAVTRRGKFLILPLGDGDELVIHLGMTGVITPVEPGKHLRVKLELDGGERPVLYFRDPRRFGRFLVVAAGDYRSLPTLRALGPEPLSEDFTVAGFRAALRRSSALIKSYLLAQKPVAGVGNIYADEALWRVRIHPLTPAKQIAGSRVAALRDAIRRVLAESLAAQGTTLNDYRTVDGEVGTYGEALAVYGHAGEPCPRCGSEIGKITVGGRGSHFCPRCQRRSV